MLPLRAESGPPGLVARSHSWLPSFGRITSTWPWLIALAMAERTSWLLGCPGRGGSVIVRSPPAPRRETHVEGGEAFRVAVEVGSEALDEIGSVHAAALLSLRCLPWSAVVGVSMCWTLASASRGMRQRPDGSRMVGICPVRAQWRTVPALTRQARPTSAGVRNSTLPLITGDATTIDRRSVDC